MDSNDTEQTRLTDLLGELSERDAHLEPPAPVQRAVMARWAARQTGTPLPADAAVWLGSRGQSTWTRVWLGLAGAAAALLLVDWGLNRSVERKTPQASEIHGVSPSVAVEPSVAPVEVATRTEPVTTGEETPAIGRPNAKPDTISARAAPADVEPFVRLLPMTDQELAGIRLARVRMRGQAAQTLGLDLRMPAPGADGFVEADVLLGEDGLARAIRFVR
ncbi:MAG: hypothetical protein HOP16_14090 [Acidobacteria bacterium]|nr:hypothetical protein [Acidobacteriota bacterium]